MFGIQSQVYFNVEVVNTFLIVSAPKQTFQRSFSAPEVVMQVASISAESPALKWSEIEGDFSDAETCSGFEFSEAESVSESEAPELSAHECGECKPCSFNLKGGCIHEDCTHCHEDHSEEYIQAFRRASRKQCRKAAPKNRRYY